MLSSTAFFPARLLRPDHRFSCHAKQPSISVSDSLANSEIKYRKPVLASRCSISVDRGIVLHRFRLQGFYDLAGPLFTHCLLFAAAPVRGCLCEASSSQRWRGTAEELGEPPEVLRGCSQQHFVPDAVQAPQPETVEPENPLHVRKSHLNLFALAAGLLKGFCIGQGTDTISHIFVEVAGDLAHGRGRALRLQ